MPRIIESVGFVVGESMWICAFEFYTEVRNFDEIYLLAPYGVFDCMIFVRSVGKLIFTLACNWTVLRMNVYWENPSFGEYICFHVLSAIGTVAMKIHTHTLVHASPHAILLIRSFVLLLGIQDCAVCLEKYLAVRPDQGMNWFKPSTPTIYSHNLIGKATNSVRQCSQRNGSCWSTCLNEGVYRSNQAYLRPTYRAPFEEWMKCKSWNFWKARGKKNVGAELLTEMHNWRTTRNLHIPVLAPKHIWSNLIKGAILPGGLGKAGGWVWFARLL